MTDASRDAKKGLGIFSEVVCVVGATATTDIAVAGIKAGDVLLSVTGVDPDAVAQADVMKEFSGFDITDGNINHATEDTSAYNLRVEYAPAKERVRQVTSISAAATNATPTHPTTDQITVTATYDDGTTTDLTSACDYSSDDEAVATVDNEGLVTTVAAGTATITADFHGLTDTVVYTVS